MHTGMAECFIIPDTALMVAFPTAGTRAVNGVNDVVHGVVHRCQTSGQSRKSHHFPS